MNSNHSATFRAITSLLVVVINLAIVYNGQAESPKTQPPNILLIVAEDMSSRVGAFGDPLAQTPNIDQLAAQGVRYTNVFTTSGVCAPSRAALITGMHAIATGTQHMRTTNRRPIPGLINYQAVPPPAVKAFPELLRRAGYATANLAKTDYQFGEPFTVWDINDVHPGTEDFALWRQLPADKPFFVMLNMMSTHETFLTPPEAATEKQGNPFLRQVALARTTRVKAITRPETVTVPPYLPDTQTVRASIAQHYDNIHFMDAQVGNILDLLAQDDLIDNTIVIWTTDHGDAFPRAKRAIYDSGLKVPLIVRFPKGSDQGQVNQRLVSFVDLAPTILELAGAPVPAHIHGSNFLTGKERPFIYAARDRMGEVNDRARAIRDKRFKYIRNYVTSEPYFRPLGFRDMFPIMQSLWAGYKSATLNTVQNFYFTSPRPNEELYDTHSDPDEIHNLAEDPDYAKVVARMSGQLNQWLSDTVDMGAIAEMEMVESMWPGLQQPTTSDPKPTLTRQGQQLHVSFDSDTDGASIGYRILKPNEVSNEHFSTARWEIYAKPITLNKREQLQAKAIRYGYAESSITTVINN